MKKQELKYFNKRLNKRIRHSSPFVLRIYSSLLLLAKKWYYRNETRLAKGKLKSSSEKTSIIFFTVHKCASTFIRDTLERLAMDQGLIPINFSGFYNERQQKESYHDPEFIKNVFHKKGFLYGAFRQYYGFDGLEGYKILLVLRDPRDVLTSHYFSTAYNHPHVGMEFIEKRKRAQSQTIDEYVLEKLPLFKERYTKYADNLLKRKNVLFVKYEDMITNYSDWLNQVAHFLDLNHDKTQIAKEISSANFKVDKENPHEFKRSVQAGDHLRKLKPETIDILNAELKSVLKTFGY